MGTTEQKVQRPASVAKQLAALTDRVDAVEQELWRARKMDEARRARNRALDEEWDRESEQRATGAAARDARWKAISEFDRLYWEERFRAVHPEIDAARRQRLKQLNAFLSARGMDAETL